MSDLLDLNCLLSNSHVVADLEGNLKLLAKIRAGEGGGPRPPLNLVLIIDRSTSMLENHKIDHVRSAASLMVQRLGNQDVLSVIDFGTDVNVLVSAQSVVDPVGTSAQLARIQAKGATNIHDALTAGLQEVAKNAGGQRVSRILLLSDGVATEGITSDDPILQIADQARQMGAAISTLGVGSDYDETLMNAISDRSGGNHYYIAKPDDAASIFAEELSKLEAVVARNLRLIVRVGAGFSISLLNARYQSAPSPGGLTVTLSELQKGKTLPVFFGVAVSPHSAGNHTVAYIVLEYEDVSLPGVTKSAASEVVVHMVADPALIRANINREVLRDWEELDAAQSVAQIVADLEAGKLNAASAVDAIDLRGQTLVKRGSSQAADVIAIAKTIATTGGVTPEIKKSTVAYRARGQGQS